MYMHVRTGELADLVGPGMTVAVGDGCGAPVSASSALSAAAARSGRVRLVLGWVPRPDPGLALDAFADCRTFMPGWGLRRGSDAGLVRFAPARLSAVPALLHGPWRPDLLVATVVPAKGGFTFGSEVSWQRSAIDAGAHIAAVLSRAAPRADAGDPLPVGRLTIIGETSEPPAAMPDGPPGPEDQAIAATVASLITPGARVQVGVGRLANAVLRAITVPVSIDSGLLPEAVVDLDDRGLLIGEPVAAYLAGGPRLYGWADGRPLLHPVGGARATGRPGAGSLFAVNPAVEIDQDGQVNVEGTADSLVGGIGGHADYAAAAARSAGGLSIIAVPTSHRGVPTLVAGLSRPVSTPAHDVDVVVTERGLADLRGLSRPERRSILADLWGGPPVAAG